MRHLCKRLAWRLGQEDLKLHNSLGYIGRKEKNKEDVGILREEEDEAGERVGEEVNAFSWQQAIRQV